MLIYSEPSICRYIIVYVHWSSLDDHVAASSSQPKSPSNRRLLDEWVEYMSSQKYDLIAKCCKIYIIMNKNMFFLKKYVFS